MNKLAKGLVLILFISIAGLTANPAFAYSPTLSANYQSQNDSLQVYVSNAAPFSSVDLFSRQSSSLWTAVNNIGQTDGSGYFTQAISFPSDGGLSPMQLYATVGGQQSATITVSPYAGNYGYGSCGYYGCGNYNTNLWFSQPNPTMYAGQSLNISINSGVYSPNYYFNSYYISTNSNPNAVTASLSGSSLTLRASQAGSTGIVVCHVSVSVCATLYVTVQSGSGSTMYLGQTSLNLNPGQNSAVSIYNNNYNVSYYVSYNSNPSTASASISGNALYISAGSPGTSTIVVCQNGYTGCANLILTVSGVYYGNNFPYGGYGNVLGANLYPNGQLISENGTVYIVYKNTKTAFANSQVFTDLGYSYSNIIQTSGGSLQNSNYIISASWAQHPWGSWVKNGGTIYFVHELGLIPVPDNNIFVSNGGRDNLVVNANAYDFRLPILSVLVRFDVRLR